MELTSSQEEYLKTIYIIQKNNEKVRVTDIAVRLKITKPSVNKAINTLRDLKLINYEAYGDITLTRHGEFKAREILKKQDILETFLVEVLEVEREEAIEEAKKMKHAMSKTTMEKLDNYVGKVLDLGDLDCGYDENNEKCKKCEKGRNRIKK